MSVTGGRSSTRSRSCVSSSCRALDIRKSQNARKLRPWSESPMASRSVMMSFEQRSPGALPERDALAHPAVQRPEVLLDLPEVV